MVYEAANAVRLPIIGMGGIATAEDAIEMILAGASAVSVGTANFYNPTAACLLYTSCAGQELAASDSDPPGRKASQRGADRFSDYGYEDYPSVRKVSSETYGRRRFPPGDLPGGAPGPDEGPERASGALLRIPYGDAFRMRGKSNDRCTENVRYI